MPLVDVDRAVLGDVLRQQRNEPAGSDVGRGIEAAQLPDAQTRQHRLCFHLRVVHADGGRHVAIDDLVVDLELPLGELARVGTPITGAAVLL